jgi:arsenate reductase
MAAALLERVAGERIDVASAGTQPSDRINPVVVKAMDEVGIDLDGRRPTALTDADVRGADVVITMGCGDECPVYPGRRYEDWEVPDPSGRPLEEVRAIRDEIEERVRALADTLP